MAADYLLELDGIKGESKDSKHPNTIEIESFFWGAKNEPRSSAVGKGGLGGGRVEMPGIKFTSTVNKASGELMLACWTGKPIKKAVLYVRKQAKTSKTTTWSPWTTRSSPNSIPPDMDQVVRAFPWTRSR